MLDCIFRQTLILENKIEKIDWQPNYEIIMVNSVYKNDT